MEIMLIIAIIVLGAVLYFGAKFVNFKSQLMNEMGKRGLDYATADALYTAMSQQINELHHNGVQVSEIADVLLNITGANEQREHPKSNFNSFKTWYDAFKTECDNVKPGVSEFLEFMDKSNLERAYADGKDPKEIAYHFSKDFDPLKIR